MKTVAIGVLAIVLVHGSASAQTAQEQEKIIRAFQQNVADLTEQHPCYGLLPEGAPTVFTLPVATVFRQVIARALDEQPHTSQLTAAGGPARANHPSALEPFPIAELHEFPAVLAKALPALPQSLEYRLIGNDLVLRHAGDDVIVAVLRDAIGGVATVKR